MPADKKLRRPAPLNLQLEEDVSGRLPAVSRSPGNALVATGRPITPQQPHQKLARTASAPVLLGAGISGKPPRNAIPTPSASHAGSGMIIWGPQPSPAAGPTLALRPGSSGKAAMEKLVGTAGSRRNSFASQPSPHAATMLRRRVVFCPTPMNSTHAITPYANVYGKHPRYFDFDRKGEMRLNDAGLYEEMRQREQLMVMNQIADMCPD
eukprot:TRINITY_DN19385_c0_g1_i1.p2 TRINITY_DN19385_c0_g1~~TRINITY_DN19385_c0_g1_i1.p2  ORF type:complete len:209 (+),score=33.83 TRINITY_DN19385_c0_g1_i1:105-731(+)